MRFTAQEEYGLRCLLQIARDPSGMSTISEIAQHESLSVAYVAKLLIVLRKSGIVESTRGQKGGYRLARPANQMRMDEVLDVLGGRLYPAEFCGRYSGHDEVCVHQTACSIRGLWTRLDSLVHESLARTTLGDLVCAAQPESAPSDPAAPVFRLAAESITVPSMS